mgnify:FL=1
MKRGKVTGIGLELEQLIEKSNLTLKELSKKSDISINLINDFITLRKEPYFSTEIQKILYTIMNEENKDEIIKFLIHWLNKERFEN